MDILDHLPEQMLFEDKDPFETDLLFPTDPFHDPITLSLQDACTKEPMLQEPLPMSFSAEPHDAAVKEQLLLDPFHTPPVSATHLPSSISLTDITIGSSCQNIDAHPLSEAVQQPVECINVAVGIDPPSPLQENRPSNTKPRKPRRGTGKNVKKEPMSTSPDQRNKEKLAQRKLRNKESARRYREKQVARRKQLENYTRTLSEQNRELELLHQRLLTLTCDRRLRMGLEEGVGNNVL